MSSNFNRWLMSWLQLKWKFEWVFYMLMGLMFQTYHGYENWHFELHQLGGRGGCNSKGKFVNFFFFFFHSQNDGFLNDRFPKALLFVGSSILIGSITLDLRSVAWVGSMTVPTHEVEDWSDRLEIKFSTTPGVSDWTLVVWFSEFNLLSDFYQLFFSDPCLYAWWEDWVIGLEWDKTGVRFGWWSMQSMDLCPRAPVKDWDLLWVSFESRLGWWIPIVVRK